MIKTPWRLKYQFIYRLLFLVSVAFFGILPMLHKLINTPTLFYNATICVPMILATLGLFAYVGCVRCKYITLTADMSGIPSGSLIVFFKNIGLKEVEVRWDIWLAGYSPLPSVHAIGRQSSPAHNGRGHIIQIQGRCYVVSPYWNGSMILQPSDDACLIFQATMGTPIRLDNRDDRGLKVGTKFGRVRATHVKCPLHRYRWHKRV
jgi:hypothetical protein